MSKRIGIFSGSFDPIHKGHIAFGLEASQTAKLDKVFFAPEVKPRRKPHVTHIAHRLSMLHLAVRSQPRLEVLELPGKYFLPKTTMVHLRKLFPDDILVLLLGSDLFEHLAEHSDQWPHVAYLLKDVELVVSARVGQSDAALKKLVHQLPVQPLAFTIAHNHEPDMSSGFVRQRLSSGQTSSGTPPSVAEYATKHWLYHDVTKAAKQSKA